MGKLGGHEIIQVYLLAAVVHLSTLVGVSGVDCYVCKGSEVSPDTCDNLVKCSFRCIYMVSGDPKKQFLDCFNDNQWPKLNVNNRWATDGEIAIVNEEYENAHVFSAYICDKSGCNKPGAENRHGHDGKSSSASSFLYQYFWFCQSLLLVLGLLCPHFQTSSMLSIHQNTI